MVYFYKEIRTMPAISLVEHSGDGFLFLDALLDVDELTYSFECLNVRCLAERHTATCECRLFFLKLDFVYCNNSSTVIPMK